MKNGKNLLLSIEIFVKVPSLAREGIFNAQRRYLQCPTKVPSNVLIAYKLPVTFPLSLEINVSLIAVFCLVEVALAVEGRGFAVGVAVEKLV